MIPLSSLGSKVKEKRGGLGIREAAKEIGLSPSTLSRIENGNIPDLETFAKLCNWLEINPSEFLGFKNQMLNSQSNNPIAVHFKKENTLKPETAKALADLVLCAQRSMKFIKR